MPMNKRERDNITAGWVVHVGGRNLTVTRVERRKNGSLAALYVAGQRVEQSAVSRVVSK